MDTQAQNKTQTVHGFVAVPIQAQQKILMVHGYAVELTVRLNTILIVHGCVDNHLTSAGNRTVKSRANSACYCCGS